MNWQTVAMEAAVSGLVVLGLSLLTEHTSPRIAGVLSGTPLGVVFVYFFVGQSQGAWAIVESVPHAIAGLSATLAFACAWVWGARTLPKFSLLAATIAGLAAFLAVAMLVSQIPLRIAPAAALSIAAAIAARRYLGRHSEVLSVNRPVRFSIRQMATRIGGSVAMVVMVIQLARIVGPQWKGILIGFPMNLLPLLVIVHANYGPAIAGSLLRQFPIGIFALFIYVLTVPFTYTRFGVAGGTLASLAVAWAYLSVLPSLYRFTRLS